MDLESTIAHHLFDSAPYLKLFKLGGIEFNITKHLVIMWFVGGFMLALFSFAARGTSRTAVLLRAALEGVALYLRDEMPQKLKQTALRPIAGNHHQPERAKSQPARDADISGRGSAAGNQSGQVTKKNEKEKC